MTSIIGDNLKLARQELYRALEQLEIASDKLNHDDARQVIMLCCQVEDTIASLDKLTGKT